MDNNEKSPLAEIRSIYQLGLDQTNMQVDKLVEGALAFQKGELSIEMLQQQIMATRLAYKEIEFLLDYFDPYLVSKSINGAPLPKLEPKVPEVKVIEPNGLQTLDELIFLAPDEQEEILQLAKKLSHDFRQAVQYQKGKTIQHRYVIEAIRYGVIRVLTLGLTGFDTPGSGNAIPEAIVTLQAMQTSFSNYQKIANTAALPIYKTINATFSEGIQLLESNTNFDTFDRLHFLKTIINPLYKQLYDFQKEMGIEFKEEVDPTLSAHNYHSDNLFSDDFLNTAFYTEVAEVDLQDANKIALGKLLFHDPALSKDLNMSCASCHQPEKAFTDGLPKSKGNRTGKFTQRSSPTLVNSAYYGRYFWDMREYDLERQVKHVVHDTLEFNIDFIDLAERLKESKTYYDLFKEAYGKRDRYGISTWSISNALAAYVNSLNSLNSPFDKYVKGEREQISESIKNGFNVFMGKGACGTCHFAPVFNGIVPPYFQDSESEVLGVLVAYDTLNPILDNDPGRIANGLPNEEAPHFLRSFKTVTVRNAAFTAPYMHNGSIQTLEEVVDFYNRGGGAGMGLDVPHQTLPDTPLNLTEKEKQDLVAFMESLSDIGDFQKAPISLPKFEKHPEWDSRK